MRTYTNTSDTMTAQMLPTNYKTAVVCVGLAT